ncbi:MAG: tRNA lysidine(34) synthetase TilS [Candidatus Acidiferrales bacterium]
MIPAGACVGVGVSGGADSVALLLLLAGLREPLGITVSVLHFNHLLRGKESDGDEQFVRKLAARQGLEFHCAREDVGAVGQAHGWNLEDAGRRLRYAFFERAVAEGRVTRVAVAHTADDQAETILARLVRGTGPTGLSGIYPVRGNVVRPLLEIRRKDLRKFLRESKQKWREDSTNSDELRLRARIRKRLLPQMERDFSTSIVAHLGELAGFAREEEEYWRIFIEDKFALLVASDSNELTIRVEDLLKPFRLVNRQTSPGELEAAQRIVSRRLVRRIAGGFPGEPRQITAEHVEQVLALASRHSSGRKLHLPGGLRVEREFERLTFRLQPPTRGRRGKDLSTARAGMYEYAVQLPQAGTATVDVAEIGRRFSLKVIDWPQFARDTKSEAVALDAARLCSPLVLRNWRPGDSYRPEGRRQVRKLKRLFQTIRIASRERVSWPVLACNGSVVWARGLPPAAEYSAGPETVRGVLIQEEEL